MASFNEQKLGYFSSVAHFFCPRVMREVEEDTDLVVCELITEILSSSSSSMIVISSTGALLVETSIDSLLTEEMFSLSFRFGI